MTSRRWLILIGAVVACVLATTTVEAQCATCCWPPPHTAASCCGTLYNGANTCVSSGISCQPLGSCQGPLGDQCESGPAMCPVEKWACGKPLKEEWRLESYTVERPAAIAKVRTKDKA